MSTIIIVNQNGKIIIILGNKIISYLHCSNIFNHSSRGSDSLNANTKSTYLDKFIKLISLLPINHHLQYVTFNFSIIILEKLMLVCPFNCGSHVLPCVNFRKSPAMSVCGDCLFWRILSTIMINYYCTL